LNQTRKHRVLVITLITFDSLDKGTKFSPFSSGFPYSYFMININNMKYNLVELDVLMKFVKPLSCQKNLKFGLIFFLNLCNASWHNFIFELLIVLLNMMSYSRRTSGLIQPVPSLKPMRQQIRPFFLIVLIWGEEDQLQ